MLLKKFWFIFSCILSLILVQMWFSDNFLLATAEEGLPFYNPVRTLHLYKSIWLDIGFGFADPFFIPRLPMYGFAAFLQLMHFSSSLIQKILFFILLLTPLLALPRLIKMLFSQKYYLYGHIAALFYLFNLYTLSQIFERFIYPLMFLWSYLPMFLLLWIQWINSGKIKYFLFLVITTFLYSDIFGLTSSFLVVSFVAISYMLHMLITEKEKFKFIIRGVLGFFIWIVFQLWWIYPIWILRNDRYSELLNTSSTLSSLKEVSQYFPLEQIILLKQGYFFGYKNFLHYFYDKPLILAISIFIFILAVIGIVISRGLKKWSYLFILFIVGLIISKGYNPPFGREFFSFVFTSFPFTQILRNPYEKFGTVFLLPYSIFFSFGLLWISNFFVKAKYLIICIILFFTIGYLVWPLWNGEIFANRVRIRVPDYYAEANNYLNKKDKLRILHLPLLQESSIRYVWDYHGEEPSEFLFDRSSLSRPNSSLSKDEFYLSFPHYFTNEYFTNILSLTSVSAIVLHRNTFRNPYNQTPVADMQSHIESWKGISKGKDFGGIVVYTLPKQRIQDFVFVLDRIVVSNSLKDGLDKVVKKDFNPQKMGIIIKSQNKVLPDFKRLRKAPQISFRKYSASKYKVHVKSAESPFVLVLSNSYNKLWNARISRMIITDHFIINGFANAWFIDKKGSYSIDIRFGSRPWN